MKFKDYIRTLRKDMKEYLHEQEYLKNSAGGLLAGVGIRILNLRPGKYVTMYDCEVTRYEDSETWREDDCEWPTEDILKHIVKEELNDS